MRSERSWVQIPTMSPASDGTRGRKVPSLAFARATAECVRYLSGSWGAHILPSARPILMGGRQSRGFLKTLKIAPHQATYETSERRWTSCSRRQARIRRRATTTWSSAARRVTPSSRSAGTPTRTTARTASSPLGRGGKTPLPMKHTPVRLTDFMKRFVGSVRRFE